MHILIVRRFDDRVHGQLGEIANQRESKRGFYKFNSKDSADKWLKKQGSEVPRKHHLFLWSTSQYFC
jgi:hypothetical protein